MGEGGEGVSASAVLKPLSAHQREETPRTASPAPTPSLAGRVLHQSQLLPNASSTSQERELSATHRTTADGLHSILQENLPKALSLPTKRYEEGPGGSNTPRSPRSRRTMGWLGFGKGLSVSLKTCLTRDALMWIFKSHSLYSFPIMRAQGCQV